MPLSRISLLRSSAIPRQVPDVANAPPEGPAAPSNLVATAVSPTQIDLTWQDNSVNETGFAIDRGSVSGPGQFYDSVGAGVTSYSDTAVNPEETWFYHVRAFVGEFSSDASNEDSATTPPSSTGDLEPDFYSPVGNIIEEEDYDLRSRVLNPDQTIHTPYDDADWNFSLPEGGPASIGGANSDVLTPNAGSAPANLVVRASYVGGEILDPTFQNRTLSIIEQPTGNFPVVLDPGGGPWTTIVNLNGSTKIWPGFGNGGEWADDNRIEVVSDANSKFGNAVQKNFFKGEAIGGWKGFNQRNIGLWSQLYVRLVFQLASNWQWHPGGGKYMYLHNSGTASLRRNFILGTGNPNAAFNAFGVAKTPGFPVAVWDFSSGQGQWVPNFASMPRGSYVTVEWLIGADITANSGFLRMARNGVEATEWALVGTPGPQTADLRSNVDWLYNDNVSDKRIGAACETFLFNGGSGGTFTANFNIRMSEFVIKGLS